MAEVTTAACCSHLRAGHGQSKWASGESLFEDGVRGTGALQPHISARSYASEGTALRCPHGARLAPEEEECRVGAARTLPVAFWVEKFEVGS